MPLRLVPTWKDIHDVGDCAYEPRKACFCREKCVNCDGKGHLHIRLPNGLNWDSDARASNCGLRGDDEHRCWVKSGDIEHLTVGKNGLTCPGGAGSIAMDGGGGVRNWHGFIRNGEFVTS